MANIYDDFDKRREHSRRFEETQMGGRLTPYSAPQKAHPAPRPHRFHSELQRDLLDVLLEVGKNGAGGEKR